MRGARAPGVLAARREDEPRELGTVGQRFLDEALQGAPRLQEQVLRAVHDVRFCDSLDTARVRLHGGRFLLEVSPAFIATHLPSAADKRFVLMHELGHLRRGDLFREGRFYRRLPRMVNFAMDMYVNGGVLGSRYFEGRAPGVLDRCYDPRELPWCLLQPPWRFLEAWADEVPGAAESRETARYVVQHRTLAWSDDDPGTPPRHRLRHLAHHVAAALGRAGVENAREAARLYLGAWSRTMPFNGFLERFHRLLVAEGLLEQVEGRPLLLEHDLEAVSEAIRRGGLWAGQGTAVSNRQVTPERVRRDSGAVVAFYQSLRAALTSDPSHPVLRENAEVQLPSVLPRLGRREAALLGAGTYPVLFQAPGRARSLSDQRVHLYLDVSGSMNEYVAFLSGLTLTAGELVGEPLYQFSNEVVSISWDELEQGHVATTGGTDLDCVARHAQRHRFRRILVVTDGYVSLDEESKRILRREVETYVVLVGHYGTVPSVVTELIEEITRSWWTLPEM